MVSSGDDALLGEQYSHCYLYSTSSQVGFVRYASRTRPNSRRSSMRERTRSSPTPPSTRDRSGDEDGVHSRSRSDSYIAIVMIDMLVIKLSFAFDRCRRR